MPMINRPIDEASDDELRTFAEQALQLELAGANTRAKLIGKIKTAWNKPFIMVDAEASDDSDDSDDANDAEAATVAPAQVEKPKPEARRIGILAAYPHDPLVELTIHNTSYPGGDKPAPANVNGGNLAIPREQRVKIPLRFFYALQEAHEINVTQDPDTMELRFNRVSNYPMTIHSFPSEAEVAKWRELTDDENRITPKAAAEA